MKCKKSRELLPLILGNELPERKIEKVRRHIENCENCKREFLEYKSVLKKIKDIGRDEKVDWEEKEWKILIDKITSQNIERKSSILIPLEKPAFLAWTLVLLVSFALIFVGRNFINKREIGIERKNVVVSKLEKEEIRSSKKEEIAILEEKNPFKPVVKAKQRKIIAKTKGQPEKMEKKMEPEQKIISMTIVSRDTGLKIVWFFNKNFEWEE